MSGNTGVPSEAFLQCQNCKKILFAVDFEQNLRVCPHCNHHHRLVASKRIELTFDENSFLEYDADLVSQDPLQFPEYAEKRVQAEKKTGQKDSIVCGTALIGGMEVAVAVADFSFMGGSMGSVAGEKITRTLERAAKMQIPAIIFCASGGARMQEGLFSLMQMAKTTGAVEKCNRAGVPYISIFTDPTMAGVLASYASVADVILAEPKALVGFAGARVSKQAGVSKVPDDFQTAEFVLRAGMLDKVVKRQEMRATLMNLVESLGQHLRAVVKFDAPEGTLLSQEQITNAYVKPDLDAPAPAVNAKTHKEWEKPLIDLEDGIAQLKELARKEQDDIKKEELETRISNFEGRRDQYVQVMYSRLGPWEKVLVARAEKRPYTLDYIQAIFTDFVEIDGDRRIGADHAIVGGPALLDGKSVMIVGHQKGRNIQERQFRNFGMAKPEGYRKAIRLFEMAERFNMPVITFVDTPAADPGVESELRGISEAIAAGILKMFQISVPSISVIIGEGGSGGAIGIAASSRVLMLEHSVYSVIPPEGCAAILWRMPERGADAARALRLTAQSAFESGLVDEIIPEPTGGAHRDPLSAALIVKEYLLKDLAALQKESPEAVYEMRHEKFRKMGRFVESQTALL